MNGSGYIEGQKTERLRDPAQARWRPSPAHSTRSEKHSFRLRERGTALERTAGNRSLRNPEVFPSASDPRLEANNRMPRNKGDLQNQGQAHEAEPDFGRASLKESVESWLLEGLTPGFGSLLTILVGFAWAGLTFI